MSIVHIVTNLTASRPIGEVSARRSRSWLFAGPCECRHKSAHAGLDRNTTPRRQYGLRFQQRLRCSPADCSLFRYHAAGSRPLPNKAMPTVPPRHHRIHQNRSCRSIEMAKPASWHTLLITRPPPSTHIYASLHTPHAVTSHHFIRAAASAIH
jgi:hypothetical protein